MNKLYLLLVFLLPTFIDIQGQVVAVKTNVLYDAITTPNIGAEVAFNKHWSVEASGYYNGWTFSSDNMISTLFLEEMRLSASSATSIGD